MKKRFLGFVFIISFIFQSIAFCQEPNIYFLAYTNRLEKKVKSNWILPHGQADKTTIVAFKIDKNGNISNANISTSSGDSEFDHSALNAVYKSSPFEAIPSCVKDDNITILLSFNQNLVEVKNGSSVINMSLVKHEENIKNEIKDNAKIPEKYAVVNISYNESLNSYKSIVETIISHSLPKRIFLRNKCLVLRMKINKEGYLETIQVIHSSNDKKFDKLYILAVKKCSFPPLPETLDLKSFSFDYVVQTHPIHRYQYLNRYGYYGEYMMMPSDSFLSTPTGKLWAADVFARWAFMIFCVGHIH